MDLSIEMGYIGLAILIVGALAIGVIAQFVGETETGYEWLVVGVAAFVGGLVASEFISAWRGFDPVYEGLALIPALIGGLVLGLVVEVATRYATGGRYIHAAV